MFCKSMTTLVVPAILLAGCNIHPLPEDFSKPDTTYQIVAKVRCEARDAIREIATGLLREYGSPAEKQLSAELLAGTVTYADAFTRRYSPDISLYFDRYAKSFIAYDFQLNMTEMDSHGFSLGLLNPFSNGTRSLGLGSSVDLSRQNNRSFRVTDEFAKLATEVNDLYCAPKARGGNLIYPIVGRIGLKETLETFVWLNEKGNLKAPSGTDVITMADTLEFTTTLKGNIDPKIELNPVTSGVTISSLGMTNSASRIHKHRLLFALSMPTLTEEKEKLRQKPKPQKMTPTAPARPRQQPATSAVSATEERAIKELDRQQYLRLNRGLERFLEDY
ncbi:hypothetical protein [Neorhizobium sp. IRS_2295]|jgi:hypothetical protein|uniref:hypothetical protein n=2 Tax=Neorhizobium TaxID=1525371 RepID=UPI003D2A1A8F